MTFAAKLEAKADFYWDKFYKFHADRFFNDRHWFTAEFPALLTASTVLEVGCGVGNTIFPLLVINPTAHVYACDFAATAIKIVHQHPEYTTSKRVTAFVADLINDDMLLNVPRGVVDACTMIFVLSAISPEAMPAAVANVKQTLLQSSGGSSNGGGGKILFRDYADGDLAQERLQRDYKQQRIGEGFYMRGDGTRAYYFTKEFVIDLFEQQGFLCDSLILKDMVKVNRSTGITMGRKFLHGVFTLVEGPEEERNSSNGGDGNHGAWIPFNKRVSKDSFTRSTSSNIEECSEEITTLENEEIKIQLNSDEDSVKVKVVEIWGGASDKNKKKITLHLEKYNLESTNNCASKVLAEVILRCPDTFHDTNIVQVRCGGGGSSSGFSGLPLFGALRWCRRALAIDHRREAVEIFRRNAVKNGWQFSYEKLRVAIEPPSEEEEEEEGKSGDGGKSSWAAAAFTGPIHGVLACIESQDSLIMVEEVLLSAVKVLPKKNNGFILLIGPTEKVVDGGGNGGGAAVEVAASKFNLQVSELPAEMVKSIENVDLVGNSVVMYRRH